MKTQNFFFVPSFNISLIEHLLKSRQDLLLSSGKVVIVIANQSLQEVVQDEKHLQYSIPEYLIRNVLFGLL